jgi:hypothetical protein
MRLDWVVTTTLKKTLFCHTRPYPRVHSVPESGQIRPDSGQVRSDSGQVRSDSGQVRPESDQNLGQV